MKDGIATKLNLNGLKKNYHIIIKEMKQNFNVISISVA